MRPLRGSQAGHRAILFVLWAAAGVAAQCGQGDAACFCRMAGGQWLSTPSTIHPTCRKTVEHQGRQRIVDIYFPRSIQATGKSYRLWFYLHGVHLEQWYLSDRPQWQQLKDAWPLPLAGNAQADDMRVLTGEAMAAAGGGGGLLKSDDQILVVPQATGQVATGQIWSSLYWPCMSSLPAKCADSRADDVGFLAGLIGGAQRLLPGVPVATSRPAFLSGYSNGGMMAQALLCKRPDVADQVAGISIIASTLGTSFASSDCGQGKQLPGAGSVPFIWVHGTADATLPYGGGTSEGVPVLSVEASVKLWAARLGCSAAAAASPRVVHSDPSAGGGLTCRDYCQQELAPVLLCTLQGGNHYLTRDTPSWGYTAGLVRWGMQGAKGKPVVPF